MLIKCGSLDYLNDNRKQLLKKFNRIIKRKKSGASGNWKNFIWRQEKKDDLESKIYIELEDYARYDIETIGLPITLTKQQGLSKTLIKKIFK